MEIENNQLLRLSTAGSVDDGKSTLIGRLLYDSKAVFEDQLDSIKKVSTRKGLSKIDLALLSDGLKDEIEQGITIDVAYRYFTTNKRKFIIADSPGHIEYTRNMITGASTANAIIILIDAIKGVVEQTKRHTYIASLLQIPHVLVCINKMDLVHYKEERFNEIIEDYEKIASKMMIKDVRFIPISALNGDNVVNKSEKMAWYMAAPLLNILETIHISSDRNKIDARFPVQTVLRSEDNNRNTTRSYAGRIEGGILRHNDKVTILPSGFSSEITNINYGFKNVSEVFSPMSVSITLKDEFDISRGDMIVKENNVPSVTQDIIATICWFHKNALSCKKKYKILHTTNINKVIIKEIIYKIDIHNISRDENDKNIGMNDICKIKIRTSAPLMIDSYRNNKTTGSFILIDDLTNETMAAGFIL